MTVFLCKKLRKEVFSLKYKLWGFEEPDMDLDFYSEKLKAEIIEVRKVKKQPFEAETFKEFFEIMDEKYKGTSFTSSSLKEFSNDFTEFLLNYFNSRNCDIKKYDIYGEIDINGIQFDEMSVLKILSLPRIDKEDRELLNNIIQRKTDKPFKLKKWK